MCVWGGGGDTTKSTKISNGSTKLPTVKAKLYYHNHCTASKNKHREERRLLYPQNKDPVCPPFHSTLSLTSLANQTRFFWYCTASVRVYFFPFSPMKSLVNLVNCSSSLFGQRPRLCVYIPPALSQIYTPQHVLTIKIMSFGPKRIFIGLYAYVYKIQNIKRNDAKSERQAKVENTTSLSLLTFKWFKVIKSV